MVNIDAHNHVKGLSRYLDDIQELQGTLYAVPFDIPIAHGFLESLDLSEAMASEGIVRIITAKDIPGENQIGGIIPDEPLFVDKHIHFWGMPVGIIIGTSEHLCRLARYKIKYEVKKLPVITCPREAAAQNDFIVPPRTFSIGNTEDMWSQCHHIFEGKVDINGQEHLYIETQGAYAYMKEGGGIYVASSTQGPTAVQKTIAKVLGIAMHQVEIDTVRLGGGFGGKEDQATPWAVMAALAAKITQKPIKISLHRMDDMRMTGKRHPYSSDYKIGLTEDLKILAYEVSHYQNAGAAADLSPAIMERTLFHSTNAYYIPHVKATAYSCKTNLPPNTAFRGFGGPQGKFVIESSISKVADALGVDADIIQKKNLLYDGVEMPYGQIMTQTEAQHSWEVAEKEFDFEHIKKEIAEFNSTNDQHKKGYAVQPICFGISFTNTMMNHARALVHIYQDGSVVVSTGAVEMGQGVNTKLLQIVHETFGISTAKIKIESTNTLRIANTSPTAASAGADLNGKALEMACDALKSRLLSVIKEKWNSENVSFSEDKIINAQKEVVSTWEQLVIETFQRRVSLSEHAHYATPVIHFDKTKEKGHPFAYHVYGTAVIVATVDCLRGRYTIDDVRIVHDFGKSMNHDIDLGQIEGGMVQGIGWMTLEEIAYNEEGRLLSNALSTYKIPDIYSAPKNIEVLHLDTEGSPLAIKKSKAVGEPPLMYGLGAYFAIKKAIQAFNPHIDLPIDAPYTPEKVLVHLYQKP